MVFELRRFGTLGGIGKGNLSFQLFSYKIEEETIDDLLTIGYFKDLQGVVNINDVILVLDLKKDREYKNIEYLIVKDLDIRKGITVSRLDASYLPSNDIPLTSSDIGEVGISIAFARGDHRHPKAIATETERGEIIIASQEEINIGEDNTKAITSLKLKNEIDNRQAVDEEINLGEDIKKYINPKQIKAIKDNLKVIIENNYNILDGKIDINEEKLDKKIDLNKEEVDNNISLINKDIIDINNNKADINLSNLTEEGQNSIKNVVNENVLNKDINNITQNGISNIQNYCLPDYNRAIKIDFQVNVDWIAPYDCYLYLAMTGIIGQTVNYYGKINNLIVIDTTGSGTNSGSGGFYIIPKGSIINFSFIGNVNGQLSYYCPLRGGQNA